MVKDGIIIERRDGSSLISHHQVHHIYIVWRRDPQRGLLSI